MYQSPCYLLTITIGEKMAVPFTLHVFTEDVRFATDRRAVDDAAIQKAQNMAQNYCHVSKESAFARGNFGLPDSMPVSWRVECLDAPFMRHVFSTGPAFRTVG